MFEMKNKGWVFLSILAILCMLPSLQSNAQRNKKKQPETAKQFELNNQMVGMLKFRSIGPAAYSGRISDAAVTTGAP